MSGQTKIDTDSVDIVQLVSDEDVKAEFGEALASIAVDQVVTWAKFVLTDDKPNANKQRVPSEEFDNIIRSGAYMPVKMAMGEIKDGHEDAFPLGVITNLKREGNKIFALAALWSRERMDDIVRIKELLASKRPVNVSWEILYGNSVIKDGVEDLLDTTLKAVTIVGSPAYAGRTQFIAVAAKKWSAAYIKGLPDSSFMHVERDGQRYFAFRNTEGAIDPSRFDAILEETATAPLPENTLKVIRQQVKKLKAMVSAEASLQELLASEGEFDMEDDTLDTNEFETKISELESKLAQASDELVSAKAEAEEAKNALKSLTEEIEPLRQFKLEAEKAEARAQRLGEIKEKFTSAGLTKPDEYFAENADKLLGMDESSLEFMLQEMVAFKSQELSDGGSGEASHKKPDVPNIPGENGELSVKDLASALRERNKK